MLLFLFALFEELADLLLHASGDGDTARAGVLEYTAEGVEGSEEGDDVLGDAVLHHDGIGGVHLNNLGIETADGARNLRIFQNHRRSKFVKTRLTDKQLIVSEIVGLDDINLLFYLTGNLDNLVFVAPGSNGVLMHTRYAGSRLKFSVLRQFRW